jgi:hypothetical protein
LILAPQEEGQIPLRIGAIILLRIPKSTLKKSTIKNWKSGI